MASLEPKTWGSINNNEWADQFQVTLLFSGPSNTMIASGTLRIIENDNHPLVPIMAQSDMAIAGSVWYVCSLMTKTCGHI